MAKADPLWTKCAGYIYSKNISLWAWATADSDSHQQLLQMKEVV